MHYRNHPKRAGRLQEHFNTGTTGHGQNSRVVQQLCHSIYINGTVCLCLDPAQLNQILIRQVSVHWVPTIIDILPKLADDYMALIGVSLGYHNLQVD